MLLLPTSCCVIPLCPPFCSVVASGYFMSILLWQSYIIAYLVTCRLCGFFKYPRRFLVLIQSVVNELTFVIYQFPFLYFSYKCGKHIFGWVNSCLTDLFLDLLWVLSIFSISLNSWFSLSSFPYHNNFNHCHNYLNLLSHFLKDIITTINGKMGATSSSSSSLVYAFQTC